MKNLTNTTTKEEFEKKFASKVNFGDILDKNNKKNEATTVSGLLKPTTQSVVSAASPNIEKKLDNLEERIDQKVDRVESLLQSVIISQQTFQHSFQSTLQQTVTDKLLTHQQEKEVSEPVETEKNGNNKNIVIAAAIIGIALITSSLLGQRTDTNKEVVTTQPAAIQKELKTQVETKVEAPSVVEAQKEQVKYVTTKFVNMRDKASSKGVVLMIVPPNSVIDLLDQKAGWNKIKFYDHVKNTTESGWVYGENLKALK